MSRIVKESDTRSYENERALPHILRQWELTRRRLAREAKAAGEVALRRQYIERAFLNRQTRELGRLWWVGENTPVLTGRYARLFFGADFVALDPIPGF